MNRETHLSEIIKRIQAPAAGEKRLILLLDSSVLIIEGQWEWELNSHQVFCSDVILSEYPEFEGTKAIIHPDDKTLLQQHLRFIRQTGNSSFRFRIITTFGEVKTLKAEGVWISGTNSQPVIDPEQAVQRHREQAERLEEAETLEQLYTANELAQTLSKSGTWYFNAAPTDTFYSDGIYRIYGLPPQGLNANLNTFLPYLHPDDAEAVVELLDQARKGRLPLHIEFRIKTPGGEVRTVRQVTQWRFNKRGESIMFGTLTDITEESAAELSLEKFRSGHEYLNRLQHFQEKTTGSGYWTVELLTRKASYSDGFYRIFGLKPHSAPGRLSLYGDYVHFEDRDRFVAAIRAMYLEHQPPNMEFRVVRPDGKIRHIRLSSKIEIAGKAEMVMVGVIEDITQQLALQNKLNAAEQAVQLRQFIADRAEEISGTGSLIINLKTEQTTWTANLFRLLGYRPNLVTPDSARILKYVHQDDREQFRFAMKLAKDSDYSEALLVRMHRSRELRHCMAAFKVFRYGEEQYLVGTFRDITESLEQQKQTAEKLELVELLTRNSLDQVLITNNQNVIIFWNSQCEDIHGLKADQVLGKNIFEVLPHCREEQWLGAFHRALKGKPVHEYHIADTTGKGRVDLHLLPFKENEEVTGLLHVIREVTKEYELKQQLTDRLGFIENILEATVDQVKVLDKQLNFLYWNNRCESHYGIKRGDVIGKNLLEVFPGLQNSELYYQFRKALNGETVTITPQPASTGQYHQSYLLPVKDEHGEVTSLLWLLHDFSKEYKLKEEQQKAYAILDTIEEGCYELDENCNIIFVNRKAEKLWNKTREELLNQNMWQVFPQAVDSALYLAVMHVLESKELVQREFISPILGRKVFINITPTAQGVIVAFSDYSHDVPAADGFHG